MKLEFLILVVCGIIFVPGESATWRLYGQPRRCGRISVSAKPFDRVGGVDRPLHQHTWAVAITVMQWASGTPHEKDVRHDCSGVVISEWFVLTSTYCITQRSALKSASYHIYYGSTGHEKASQVHVIGESPFMLLEVETPFTTDILCLTYAVGSSRLNNTIWTASWSLKYVPGVSSVVYTCLEQWTQSTDVKLCKASFEDVDKYCTCARPYGTRNETCRVRQLMGYQKVVEEAGTPVLRWNGNKWYLIGMTTGGNCSSGVRDKLLYESFANETLAEIERLVMSKADPDDRDPDDRAPLRSYCGIGEKLRQLGSEKKVAPFVLPWIVRVHGTAYEEAGKLVMRWYDLRWHLVHSHPARNHSVKCTGTLIREHLVVTADACIPEGFGNGVFKNPRFKVIYEPEYASRPREIDVVKMKRPKPLEASYALFYLASPVDKSSFICLSMEPYNHKGEDVVAASWAFNDVQGKFEKDMLYYEKWTLPDNLKLCDGKCLDKGGRDIQTRMCAEAGNDTYYACQGDLGTAVMHRYKGNWYLVGMVTHVDVGREDCEVRKTRGRAFRWIFSPNKTVCGSGSSSKI